MSIVTRFVEWLRIVSFQEYSLQHFILLSIGAKKPGAINLLIYSWSPHLIRRNSIGSLGEWSSDLRLLQLLCRATWKSLIQNRENTLSFCTLVTLTRHFRMQLQCLTYLLSSKKISFPNKTPPFHQLKHLYLSLASPLHPPWQLHRSVVFLRITPQATAVAGQVVAGKPEMPQPQSRHPWRMLKISSPFSYQYHLKIFVSISISSVNETRNQYQINLSNQINITMYNLLYNLGFWDAAKGQSWYKIDSFWWRSDFSRPCIAIFQDSPMDVFRHQKNSTWLGKWRHLTLSPESIRNLGKFV